MVFKRIDRYVSWGFLARFFGGMFLIAALYASFDVLKRLEELQQGGLRRSLATLAAYYGYLLPAFLLEVVPGLILVSAGLVLVRMAKQRELLALKASGTSLYRVTAPIFFWTAAISALAFAVREVAGPELAHGSKMLGCVLDDKVEREILLRDPVSNRKLFVGQYDFSRRTMDYVSVLEFHPGGSLSRTMLADSAEWLPEGGLLLKTVQVREFDPAGAPTAEPVLLQQKVLEVGLGPLDVVQAAEQDGGAIVTMRRLKELRAGIGQYPGVPYFRVAFHSRLASFFGPIILLLLGVPCLVGFERSVNSRFLGVVLSILLAGGLYALTFVFSSMGNSGTLHAVLAGWLPTIMSGAAGLWLFESMLT